MKKMLIFLLITSIPFGIGMSLILGDASAGVMAGLFFGALMAVFLGIINAIFLKSVGGSIDEQVKQESEIEMLVSTVEAFELCKQSLVEIKRAKITFENEKDGVIQAKTGINLRTWGDKIFFRIQEMNDGYSKITIQSKPFVPTTLLDYGKNLENIKLITAYIRRKVPISHS